MDTKLRPEQIIFVTPECWVHHELLASKIAYHLLLDELVLWSLEQGVQTAKPIHVGVAYVLTNKKHPEISVVDQSIRGFLEYQVVYMRPTYGMTVCSLYVWYVKKYFEYDIPPPSLQGAQQQQDDTPYRLRSEFSRQQLKQQQYQ